MVEVDGIEYCDDSKWSAKKLCILLEYPLSKPALGWLQNDVILHWVVWLGREFFPDSKSEHREHPRSKCLSKGGGIPKFH